MISGDDAETLSAHPKVWRKHGALFGVAGDLGQLQTLYFQLKCSRYRTGRSPVHWLGSKLAPEIRALIPDRERAEVSILCGVGGRLFYLDCGFSFVEVGPEWAIGSGGDAARAALQLLPPELGPQRRIERALEVASRICLSVGPPFDLVSL